MADLHHEGAAQSAMDSKPQGPGAWESVCTQQVWSGPGLELEGGCLGEGPVEAQRELVEDTQELSSGPARYEVPGSSGDWPTWYQDQRLGTGYITGVPRYRAVCPLEQVEQESGLYSWDGEGGPMETVRSGDRRRTKNHPLWRELVSGRWPLRAGLLGT